MITIDKRVLDAADAARKARVEQLAEPLAPGERPYAVIDGKTYRYVGPFDPEEENRILRREREELQTLPLPRLILYNTHVHAAAMAMLYALGQSDC